MSHFHSVIKIFHLIFLNKKEWCVYIDFAVMHNPNIFLTGFMRFTGEFWCKGQLSDHVLYISTGALRKLMKWLLIETCLLRLQPDLFLLLSQDLIVCVGCWQVIIHITWQPRLHRQIICGKSVWFFSSLLFYLAIDVSLPSCPDPLSRKASTL